MYGMARSESSRRHLVDAAKELLWKRGFESTSPRAIQHLSGAGQGSFYHHFDGKVDLASVALQEVASELSGSAQALLDPTSGRPGMERLTTFLLAPRDALRGCRVGRLAQEREAIETDQLRIPIARYFENVQGLLVQAIEDAIQEGTLPAKTVPADLAAMLTAIVQGAYVIARAQNDADCMTRAINGALALIAR